MLESTSKKIYLKPVLLSKVSPEVLSHSLPRKFAIKVFVIEFKLGLVYLFNNVFQLLQSQIS